ncbi:universal stress protein [Streptomyces sp. NPDC047079]|uniref:universal stress protein n=1 Tax=Streptomyces sp. NPDC047079 TaxID=3154607 RepID=UPI0033C64C0D
MELPLVVGVDGSEPSLIAVDWAVDEAARHGLPLRLVYGSLWERYEGGSPSDAEHRSAERRVGDVVDRAAECARRRNPAVAVSADVLPEDAVSALLHEARSATALITGSRGRGGLKGLLLGSVGLAVAARAHCPVIVVRGDRAGLTGAHERILLGAGDPDSTAEAVRFAFREAEARACVLDVVRAWRRPAHETTEHHTPVRLHEQRASLQIDILLREQATAHPDVRVRPDTVEGPARTVLLKRSAAADLVIIGARRAKAHFGLQLGRVGHTLLHHADCPVAIVPQHT